MTDVVQGSLFDVDERTYWFGRAEALVARLIRDGGTFSVDTLRGCGLSEPPHPNMWGQLTRRLSLRHVIVSTGRIIRSGRQSRRGAWEMVWEAARP